MSLRNDVFLRALRREPVPYTPVWLMRQAGRYLPEYRATRQRAGSFLALCKTPELATEVTLQPLARFALDAAILFSDILTIPDALGLELDFVDGEGPVLRKPIRSRADIDALPELDTERALDYVMAAVRMIRRELDGRVPLIGFSGAPWTLSSYMLEGGSSSNFKRAKCLMWNDAAAMRQLLDKLASEVSKYLISQAQAGAQALMVFDSWAGVLAPSDFNEFVLPGLLSIVATVKQAHPEIPLIVFAKGANHALGALSESGADALGLDWTISLREARERTQGKVALQGNLDPMVLYTEPDAIRTQVHMNLEQFGSATGHVFNLGHGMNPDMSPEHAGVLVDAVHEISRALRGRWALA
jgi:uroporphyrinogen decarboxylase